MPAANAATPRRRDTCVTDEFANIKVLQIITSAIR
jgi:hypothetical protein